jgi:hypothetical protein
MAIEILTADGYRAPPSGFVKMLKRFDPDLRVRWGAGQAIPFFGWIIERRIPQKMKKRLHKDTVEKMKKNNPHWSDDGRYADQVILDEHENVILKRAYDMLPDWHEVYRCMDNNREPVPELGEFVIDYLRKNYEKTLLGTPVLAERERRKAADEKAKRDITVKYQRIDEAAQDVIDHRFEIFHETEAFVGPPAKVFKKEQHEQQNTRSPQGGKRSVQDKP